jgi:hypothetical protein
MIIQGGTLYGGNYNSTIQPGGNWVTANLQMNLLSAPTVSSSGSTWTDVSGNGNNGTLLTQTGGSFTYTADNGGGLIASGSGATGGDSTRISTSYALTSPFTIEMWCKPNGQRTWSTLWGSEVYSLNTGWWAVWEATGTLTAGAVNSGIGYTTSYTQTTPQHYVFTLTGTTFTFYLNGVAITGSGSYSAPSGGVGSSSLIFGSRHPNAGGTTPPTDALDGTFYQMRVYNSALSSSQVAQNYSGTRGMLGV